MITPLVFPCPAGGCEQRRDSRRRLVSHLVDDHLLIGPTAQRIVEGIEPAFVRNGADGLRPRLDAGAPTGSGLSAGPGEHTTTSSCRPPAAGGSNGAPHAEVTATPALAAPKGTVTMATKPHGPNPETCKTCANVAPDKCRRHGGPSHSSGTGKAVRAKAKKSVAKASSGNANAAVAWIDTELARLRKRIADLEAARGMVAE